MIETICVILLFFVAILIFVWMANRLDIPAPIFLVPAGIATAYIPGFPSFRLDPDLVLLVFLPPLVYGGGFFSSWSELRKNLRPVFMLSVGLVIFSTLLTAWFVNHFIPGFGWATALILGAIVSPPDDVAIIAIADKIGLPERIVTVLEGEGLFNDATALTIFRFALGLVVAKAVSPAMMALEFVGVAAGEIAYGIALGWAAVRIRRQLKEAELNTLLSMITPYLAYIPPVVFGGSGVLATAVAGIYVGRQGAKFLPFTVRLRGQPVWALLIFLLNSSLFFLTGLQFRPVMLRLTDYSWDMLTMYGVALTLAVIAIRFLWVFPASYLSRLFGKRKDGEDSHSPWQWNFIVAWSGMRGAVSLAAAFAIPMAIGDYTGFPQRDLIVFLTFCVIIGTLVLQGAGLTPLVRWLGIDCHVESETKRNEQARHRARQHAARAALDKITHWKNEKRFSPSVLKQLHERYSNRIERLEDGEKISDGAARAALELVMVERETLIELRKSGELSDNQLREIEADLDIMEMQIRRSRSVPF